MKKMLIIDDSAYGRKLIRTAVTKLGINVTGEAESGAEGVEKYKELSPDIVTIDLAMDKMDGVETLKQILAYDANAYVLILSSVAGQEAVAHEAVELGAKHVFDKPLNMFKFQLFAEEEGLI